MKREDKLAMLSDLCADFTSCADCPVRSDQRASMLCDNLFFSDLSEVQLDRLLSHFKNAKQAVECTGYDKVKRHKMLCDKIHSLYKKKNHDYGDSFGQSFNDYGPLAGLVRMEDKFNRLKTLVRCAGQEVKDESIMDTLMDLVNYAIMTMLEMEG